MCVHHTKNYEAIKEKTWLREATEMDREENLRRWREQERARKLRGTVEERETRLAGTKSSLL